MDTLQMLVREHPAALSISNHNDSLPLHCALEVSGPETTDALKLLLAVAPLTAKQQDGRGLLPLHLAVLRPKVSIELVQLLLQLHPEGAKHSSHTGAWLPLHCAVCRPNPNK